MEAETLDLTAALRVAKAAEQKAANAYDQAAGQTTNPLARRLFQQLADFERHHYNTLIELEQTLLDEGAFIAYEGKELSYPKSGEVESIEDAERQSTMAVITMAIAIEQEAETRYQKLAEQTSDPDGRSMFERLAQEEHSHYLVLNDAYWSLNDRGEWAVPY
jgi:rubrerythrin